MLFLVPLTVVAIKRVTLLGDVQLYKNGKKRAIARYHISSVSLHAVARIETKEEAGRLCLRRAMCLPSLKHTGTPAR